MKVISGILLLFLSNLSYSQLTGYVRDNFSQPVADARIVFTDEQDPEIKYEALTDASGYYNVTLTSVGSMQSKTTLFEASPNPFYYGTAIPFLLDKRSEVLLAVYNMQGKQIRILEDATLPADKYVYSWDGCYENGIKATAGMYVVVLDAGGRKFTQKVILLPSHEIAATGTYHELKSLTVTTYKIIVTAQDADSLVLRNVMIPETNTLDFNLYRQPKVPFATVDDYLGIWNGNGYDPIFIKGVNLGVAIPGTFPGELAATREQYNSWLTMIADAGFNSIRIYTLHYPRFYQELALYNNLHPDKPVYLFQGIWLQEDTLTTDNIEFGNLFHYTDGFDNEIKEVVDCIHGEKTITERWGKAYGKFDADVSRWTIGFIIGREILAQEVQKTNFLNNDIISFDGSALKLQNGTPTEVWLTERLDRLINDEKSKYKVQRPVSVSSWPQIDPLEHPSEPDSISYEDLVGMDLQDINTDNAPAGYFASYHVYPYYPDFINTDTAYLKVKDEEGTNSYLGYLHHLKKHYAKRPLIIAEYGVPTSWGMAHKSSSGMPQGGISEVQQGEMDVRMLKNIRSSGCGGGMLFAWIDEWFKRTWIVENIRSDPQRIPLWHSPASAEENFGLIAFDPGMPQFNQYRLTGNPDLISDASAATNAEFFHIKLHLSHPISSGDSLWVGIDTYNETLGESVLPNHSVTDKRAEFALLVKTDSAKLFVTQAYNLYGIWFIYNNASPEKLFHSVPTDGAPWFLVRLKNNREDSAFQNNGYLKVRQPLDAASSLDAVWFNGNEINIRIPWHYLNYTDPSALLVMDDNRNTNARETTISDGIALTISYKNEKVVTDRFVWSTWNQAPVTTQRMKPGLPIVADGNREIGDKPPSRKKKR